MVFLSLPLTHSHTCTHTYTLEHVYIECILNHSCVNSCWCLHRPPVLPGHKQSFWRKMGYVNSAACVGDALRKASQSTWCGPASDGWAPAGLLPTPTELTQISKNGSFWVGDNTLTWFVQLPVPRQDCPSKLPLPFHLTQWVPLTAFAWCERRSFFAKWHRDGENGGKLEMCRLSLAKALGGTKTKDIKQVITKPQQESGNATYSISLSYGIYRKKNDKQRV